MHKVERTVTATHMGKGRLKWFIKYIGGVCKMFVGFRDNQRGRRWRTRIQKGMATEQDYEKIPEEIRKVYKASEVCVNKDGIKMNGDMYGDMFTAPITLEELTGYIKRTKKNTAPGKSGIRIDHIAALPEHMHKAIADLLSLPYVTGLGFDMWNDEIANWTPKEEGNMDINKRRPLMYYEVMRKMHMGVRNKKVLKVWQTNGIIDESNYAFLTGKSTMQPLMIKKMVLEHAEHNNNPLTMIDVDFAKAYDSTEGFAKEMTLRRMGFPEEGIDLWRQYDTTRRMRVLTAYGYTEPISPECGAWGQGAVESPIGWLAFMCWMSAYVEQESKDPYIYKTKHKELKITKVIYADDGTYFQASRTGAQRVLNAVADFATATGIQIKPQKSYVYSNREGAPLTMNTYTHTSGLEYHTLTGKKNTKLAELKDDEFFKHLGNIQNAKGESPIDATHMYDGSEATNIYEKIKTELAALRARNITAGGTLQAIKTVVYRQILYPMTYANTNHMVLDKFQRLINTTLRNKFKMPSHLHTYTLYMHEDAGGIGQDEIIDMVNIDRLVLLVSCLNQSGEMNTIMT